MNGRGDGGGSPSLLLHLYGDLPLDDERAVVFGSSSHRYSTIYDVMRDMTWDDDDDATAALVGRLTLTVSPCLICGDEWIDVRSGVFMRKLLATTNRDSI